jgi:hypothetical protein
MAPRAYSLPLVIVMVALLSAGLTVLLTSLQTSSTTTMRLFRRTQAQYAITGVARAGAVAAGDLLIVKPPLPDTLPLDPSAAAAAIESHLSRQRDELNTELAPLLPALTPAGFVLDELRVDRIRPRVSGQVQEGAFRGMSALIQPYDLVVRGHQTDLREGAFVRVDVTVERLFIPMFQFFAFIDGYAFIFNGPGAKYAGRIHSNGNMCIGSGDDSFFEKLTSGGFIYKLRGSGCRGELSGGIGTRSVFVSRTPLANGAGTYASAGFASGFSLLFDKDADSADWTTAAGLWNGQVQDATHGVPVLRAPIRGTPLVQQGRNAVHALQRNNANSRFLIDPVLPAEPLDVRAQKVAFKADLRILDGVWYLRDPATPEHLGRPIWSDHPGHYQARGNDLWVGAGDDVGQGDLFGGAARPQRYSYYRTAPSSVALTSSTARAVVSYGVLHRESGPVWSPGFTGSTAVPGCEGGTNSKCFPTQRATSAAQLLQGTRGGFRSAWDETGTAPGAADCGADREASLGLGDFEAGQLPLFNMLPINIDVGALQEALQDTGANELGAVFLARGEPFNGAVWVGATWPGFRDGYGDASSTGRATYWPFQGLQDDAVSGFGGSTPTDTVQPIDGLTGSPLTTAARYQGYSDFNGLVGGTRRNPAFQRALPQPLCTDSTFSDPAAGAMASYDGAGNFGTGTGRRFFVPPCAPYHAGTLNARVNAVRVVNGAVLSKAVLPKGLSIVTHLPMFVLGSLNTSSVPADRPDALNATWVPLMIGGDTIGLLSNAWTDDEAPWNVPVRTFWELRDADSTRYHGAFLYGWGEAAAGPAGGCREELSYSMRLHEHWHRGAGLPHDRVVRGSIFVGWNAVYGSAFSNVHEANSSGAWHDGDGATKIYSYDHHLDQVANQPPAAPQFQLTNVLRQFSN